jgi:hypothetical protein
VLGSFGLLPSLILGLKDNLAVMTSRRGVRGVSGSCGELGYRGGLAIFRVGGALGVAV